MTPEPIRPPARVAVLGAGNMGSGIAQAAAQAGFEVRVRDLDESMLTRGRVAVERTLQGAIDRKKMTPARRDEVLGRIRFTTDVAEAVEGARLVVEAIFEEEALKLALFQEVALSVAADAVVATNTSSLSVTRLQAGFPEPARFAGLHFFFPAAINRLIEVIGGAQTSDETLGRLEAFSYALRKIPIRVSDRAGFAVNRYFVPYLNESARLADEGVASLATIEEVGRETFGTTLGPFELMNVTGVPIAFHSESSLERAFGPAYAPSPLLEKQFRAGRPWSWKETSVDPANKPAVRARLLGLVFGIAAELVEEGVATAEATDRGATVGLRWKRGPFALMSEVGVPEAFRLVEAYAALHPGEFPVAGRLRTLAHERSRTWPLSFVRVERRGPVAWVLLDRPEVLNSLHSELLGQLDHAFQALDRDPSVRVVVLAGSSPVFAAGADIGEMAEKSLAEGRAFGFVGQAVCRRIEEFRAPVLALIEGYALGGGFELALAADFMVAAEGARVGLPEVSVGIHPGFGGASRLTRLIGRARTKFLVYSGVPNGISVEEAAAWGIVAKVFPPDRAREETQALGELIASRAPLALSWVKSVINRGMDAPLETALRIEGESAGHTFGTEDRREGMRAFLERRPPKFEGK